MFEFTEEQIKRYSRHIILPEVGGKGQEKINNAKVLAIGAGGLGCPSIIYLAAAGVGKIGVVDMDVVDLSNLQRQILHTTKDLEKLKTQSVEEKLNALNPDVKVIQHNERITSENALDIIKDYDIVIDGCDNFPTRYLVNDACVFENKPLVHGAIFRFEGQVTTIIPDDGPCYRCLFHEPPPPGTVPSCQEAGVLGVLPGIVGVIQATEAIKYILGIGNLLKGRLLLYDALNMEFREVKVPKDPDCPVCGENPTIKELIDYEEFCGLKKEE
ncbi:MAG: adenylyltransferase [Candidatus Altiarchaeales archaeon WOR_SM1_79]|nr:MAG: adenylyltransferase [Candidatus Altiarchaeales archaeon WOR_SM1_79]